MPLPSDDLQQRRPDITIARETLNWTPLQLREGLNKTIACSDTLLPGGQIAVAAK